MGVLGTTNTNNPDNKGRGLSAANGSNPPPAGPPGFQGGAAGPGGGPGRPNGPGGPPGSGLAVTGGAAIMAPVSAFPGGIPTNALIVLPLAAPSDELKAQLEKGPVALTPDQMWKLLGFNGPAVQVQDDQGRPLAIGLEDLISGLQKHWDEAPDDLNRGRILAQELLKYGKLDKGETVLSRIVAKGGQGDDWLALGVAQLQQNKLDRAEGTLRGAQNLMPDNPHPSLHMAKMARDVRLADNYFEALVQSRQIDKVTKLLNALAGSPNREVKQFAIERSRAVAQFLQQQQAQLAQAAQQRKT